MRYLIFVMLFCSKLLFANTTVIKVGDTPVKIHTYAKGRGKSFVHLHQNETTALRAAQYIIRREGGKVLTLEHPGGERNIVFHLKKKRYEFDPNRIFTQTGIKKTLKKFGAYDVKAHREVNKLAVKLKKMLPKGKVIAIHNNKNYSLSDYMPGHTLAAEVSHFNIHNTCQCRNFFLVTRLSEYLRLKNLKFNEVLQTKKPTDDGSLSVFLAAKNYINVEAGFNQLTAQIKMLQAA